ncbi:DNA-directed RNA polymerase III subunit RPC7-like isoform X2 [Corythoichthys intestinalis]|uniref:DNA-directed RNA polymerase III subunit RPC7-like isoform X2 n=1 Tax=Corythoichthys intestinalis TaxID=161448 RepID=UPI0025A5F3D4|nr:DNA-directed RNA polymerase III subunit RPC7-like isoform X2 [Corythoichthys intestinalis]XP_061789043.1 DNA-directed RNA polymerase III subunit RPC7-like [Nerophis lumbriciformis]
MSGGRGGRRGGEPAAVNRGEPLLPSVQQPGPPFPAAERKPLPLACGEEAEYLLALKQEFRGAMKTLPGFTQIDAAQRSHADVERYSDKYHNGGEQTDALTDWIADLKRFPKEIRPSVGRAAKKGRKPPDVPSVLTGEKTLTSGGTTAKKAGAGEREKSLRENREVAVKLETLASEERRRGSDDEEEEEEEEKKEEQEEADDNYDEEELEEETDYIMSYFDNGEEFGGESDDNADEAVY